MHTSRYARVVNASALGLAASVMTVLLNQPAPVIVYKAFQVVFCFSRVSAQSGLRNALPFHREHCTDFRPVESAAART